MNHCLPTGTLLLTICCRIALIWVHTLDLVNLFSLSTDADDWLNFQLLQKSTIDPRVGMSKRNI